MAQPDELESEGMLLGDGAKELALLEKAVAVGDVDEVLAITRAAWYELLLNHSVRVRELFEQLPLGRLKSEPLLLMMLGLYYNAGRLHRMRGLRYFALAVRAARDRNKDLDPVDRVLIRAVEAASYRLIGRPTLGAAPARTAVRLLDDLSEEDRERVTHISRVYAQLGIALYYAGAVDESLDVFAKGLAASPTSPPSSGFGNVAMLSAIHAFRGNLELAREYTDYAHTGPWYEIQRNMYTGTMYRVAEAVLALEQSDPASARRHLESMKHERKSIEHWIAIGTVEALASMVEGRPGHGLATLEALVALRGGEGRSPGARAALAGSRALLQLALGNPDAATAILRRDARPGTQTTVNQARVDLVLGRTGAAMQKLREIAGDTATTRLAAEAAAIEASVLLRLSNTSRARGVIMQLGGQLEQTGLRLPLLLLPPSDLHRVTLALADAGFDGLFAEGEPRALLAEVESDSLLSEREVAVLAALVSTSSVAEIAASLVVSTNTVKTQLRSIYRKLGVTNREDAVAIALDRHLLVERD